MLEQEHLVRSRIGRIRRRRAEREQQKRYDADSGGTSSTLLRISTLIPFHPLLIRWFKQKIYSAAR